MIIFTASKTYFLRWDIHMVPLELEVTTWLGVTLTVKCFYFYSYLLFPLYMKIIQHDAGILRQHGILDIATAPKSQIALQSVKISLWDAASRLEADAACAFEQWGFAFHGRYVVDDKQSAGADDAGAASLEWPKHRRWKRGELALQLQGP